jgi:hypothetical protein
MCKKMVRFQAQNHIQVKKGNGLFAFLQTQQGLIKMPSHFRVLVFKQLYNGFKKRKYGFPHFKTEKVE